MLILEKTLTTDVPFKVSNLEDLKTHASVCDYMATLIITLIWITDDNHEVSSEHSSLNEKK